MHQMTWRKIEILSYTSNAPVILRVRRRLFKPAVASSASQACGEKLIVWWQMTKKYWVSSHRKPAQTFVSMLAELNHWAVQHLPLHLCWWYVPLFMWEKCEWSAIFSELWNS